MKKIFLLITLFLFTACNTPVNQSGVYYDATPTISQFETFKVIPADNPHKAGYQPWIFSGSEITVWLKRQMKVSGSTPELSPWLDSEYFVLDKENAIRAFEEFHRSLRAKGIRYVASARDCDDFAFAFKSWLQFLYTDDSSVEAAAAVAVIFVRQKHAWARIPAGGAHALVAVGTNEGVVIYEPQTKEWSFLIDYPNRSEIYYIIR
jgi:hypothetical protein